MAETAPPTPRPPQPHGTPGHARKLVRAAWALSLVALTASAVTFAATVSPVGQLKSLGDPRRGIQAGAPKTASFVESVVGQAQSVSRWGSLTADYCVWYAVVLMESARRANGFTVLQL